MFKIDFSVCCMKKLYTEVIILYLSSFLCSANMIHFSSFWFGSLLYSLYSNHFKKSTLHFKIFLIQNILAHITWYLSYACEHAHMCAHRHAHRYTQGSLPPCLVFLCPLLAASEISLCEFWTYLQLSVFSSHRSAVRNTL